MTLAAQLPLLLPLLAAPQEAGLPPAAPEAAPWQEEVHDFGRYAAAPSPAPRGALVLERVTTAVPWPRGLAWVDDELVVLARGRHRRAGGVDPAIEDHAGSLFAVDPAVAEPVVVGAEVTGAVRTNARLLAAPQGRPFYLYDPTGPAPVEDVRMDRPYCTLLYDEGSRNLFLCGFSGVDLPGAKFRKNATDSIHRYHLDSRAWHSVELHDASVVPVSELGRTTPNQYYPHHDPEHNTAPHGWLNGANGGAVVGDTLYCVGKDNHLLVAYDLAGIRRDPTAGPPESRPVLGSRVQLSLGGEVREVALHGHSAVAARDGWLYLGFRTSSVVVRYALEADGSLAEPLVGELIAVFDPYDAETRKAANLIDLAFDSEGALYVACASAGAVWRVGTPDPARVFDGRLAGEGPHNRPWLSLPALTGKPKARCGNILFDPADRLYVCSGNYDETDSVLAGVVYRARRSR